MSRLVFLLNLNRHQKLTLVFLCLFGCQPPVSPPPTTTQSAKLSEDNHVQQEKETETDDDKDTFEQYGLIDIDNVKIEVTKDIKIVDSIVIEGVKAPLIEVTKNGAAYVQVLRCSAGYRFETTLGESITTARKSKNWRLNLRSAWVNAWNDSNNCQVVGEYIMAGKYPDLAADTGAFYYVFNPCITQEQSISRREECSYDLVVSRDFEYVSQIQARLRDKVRELSAAESELNGLLAEIGFIALKFKENLRACEDMIAHDRKMLAFKKGMLQLGFMVAGTAAGSALGSPNLGIMAGQVASGIGTDLVASQILKWPIAIANTCLSGPDYAGPAETDEGTKTVTPLYNRMIDLLMTEIPAATDRVQQIQTSMSELNSAVVTYDEMIASATAKGIDLLEADESTGIPSGLSGLTAP